MPPVPPELFVFLNQLQICSAEKNTLEKNVEIMAPLLKFLATLLPLCLHACIYYIFSNVGLFNEWAQLVLGWKAYPADNAHVA